MAAHGMTEPPARRYDAVIVGGGPAASATAMYLLQRGIPALIIEREPFPRYHIGESLIGETGNCLRALGLEAYMGTAAYPVKHGVTVWGAGGKNSFWVPVKKRAEDGTLQATTTWQVRRTDFDSDLLRFAIERGADYLPGTVDNVIRDDDRVAGVVVTTPEGRTLELSAEVVVDASGQATFLANRGVASPRQRGRYERQVAFFSQVTGALRDEGAAAGNTLIFYEKKHHWAWFIPLSDEATSVGVVVPGEYYRAQGLSTDAFLKRELVQLNPELSWRLQDVAYIEPVRTASNYSYYTERFTGPGFLCVGDSHQFVDPIFSFGVFFAMKEAEYASAAIAAYLGGETGHRPNPFQDYEERAERGQRVIRDLIHCFWDFPLAFQRMVHHAYPDDMIDCFAGRIYGEESQQSEGVLAMRRLLARRLS